MRIRDWPIDQRPRERLLSGGPDALSDAELLAVLLRTGTAGKHAVELARELLAQAGGLRGLSGTELASRRARRRARPCPARAVAGGVRTGAAQPARGTALPRRARVAGRGARLPGAVAARPRPRGVRRAVPRRAEPPDRRGGTVSRHADPDRRLPARSRAPRARTQQRRADPGAQSPVRRGRAERSRPDADAGAEGRAGSNSTCRCSTT